jgi:ubiquinol-cytochrome c reductase cytochrome c subunit
MRRGGAGAVVAALVLLCSISPALAADGATTFAQRCATCHGSGGEGRGSFPPLQGSPRLADAGELASFIRQGGGGMPSFASLPEEEIQALVLYVQETWGEGPQVPATDSESAPPALEGDPTTGAALFSARCVSCHGSRGEGRGPYPALKDNPAVGDIAAVESLILQGRGGMPAYPELSPEDLADLVAYLGVLAGVAPTGEGGAADEASGGTPTTTPAPTVTGDASLGERLFTGSTSLAEGGGACIACHVAGAHGAITGGALGADLSGAFQRYGSESALAGVLENPAFPVMRAAYAEAPLAAQERADLAAFLATLDPADSGSSALADRFWIFGLVGAVALFGVVALVASRRQPGLAQRLRDTRRQRR